MWGIDWQLVCQILILVNQVLSFFLMAKLDIEGREARAPMGFIGFIGTALATVLGLTICYAAGAYSRLF